MEIKISPHSKFEDAMGLTVGTLFVALAVLMFRQAGLATGGTTGVAFLIYYSTGWPLGWVLFAINLPFYIFGWTALGHAFTFKTFAAVAQLSLFIEWIPTMLTMSTLSPVFAAILGGLLTGTGILIIIRHGASLGGVTIVAIYMQKRHGWRAGAVQMAIDGVILVVAFGLLEPVKIAISLVGAAAINLVIGVNHKNGRYFGA